MERERSKAMPPEDEHSSLVNALQPFLDATTTMLRECVQAIVAEAVAAEQTRCLTIVREEQVKWAAISSNEGEAACVNIAAALQAGK